MAWYASAFALLLIVNAYQHIALASRPSREVQEGSGYMECRSTSLLTDIRMLGRECFVDLLTSWSCSCWRQFYGAFRAASTNLASSRIKIWIRASWMAHRWCTAQQNAWSRVTYHMINCVNVCMCIPLPSTMRKAKEFLHSNLQFSTHCTLWSIAASTTHLIPAMGTVQLAADASR